MPSTLAGGTSYALLRDFAISRSCRDPSMCQLSPTNATSLSIYHEYLGLWMGGLRPTTRSRHPWTTRGCGGTLRYWCDRGWFVVWWPWYIRARRRVSRLLSTSLHPPSTAKGLRVSYPHSHSRSLSYLIVFTTRISESSFSCICLVGWSLAASNTIIPCHRSA